MQGGGGESYSTQGDREGGMNETEWECSKRWWCNPLFYSDHRIILGIYLFYSWNLEVQWLPRGSLLTHIYYFLTESKSHLVDLFDKDWLCQLGYMTIISHKLNEFNYGSKTFTQTYLKHQVR